MSDHAPTNSRAKKHSFPFFAQLLLALVLGALVGVALGPRATILGELGVLVVRMLKALATPLVFFAVTEATSQSSIPAKKGLRLLSICLVNGAVAGVLAISLSSIVRPGARFDQSPVLELVGPKKQEGATAPTLHPLTALDQLVPESVLEPLLKNNVLGVVLLALLVGSALRGLKKRGSGAHLSALVSEGFQILGVLLGWIVRIVPLAVFGVVAKVVGTTGFGVFASLGLLVMTVAVGLSTHVFVYYASLVRFFARRPVVPFFRAAIDPLLTALTTGSSMATLPVTLRTLEERLGVSRESARLAACVGTNFNNDGIMLYEVVAALFVAQVSGVTLGTGQVVELAATSALAAAGIAGVPEAGLITLSLVLSSVGLPLTLLPVLLTVDWFLGRLRAATNVASDMVVAAILDSTEKRP